MLYELGFESDEIIQIQKLKHPDPIEIPLLDKNDKIVPELRDVVTDWFQQYSIEVDREAFYERVKKEEEDYEA